MTIRNDDFDNGSLKRLARSSITPPSLRKTVPARLAIIEPNGAKAELLHYFCSHHWGFHVVVLEKTGLKGIAAVRRANPELILASAAPNDVRLPHLLVELRKAAVAAKLVLFASYCNDYLLHTIESAECHGLVYEPDEDLRSIGRAIARVMKGFRFASVCMERGREILRRAPHSFPKLLTKREQEVLGWIGLSLSDDEIGTQLACSSGTARTHRREVMRKLGIHSTPKLIRFCIDKGFVSLATSVASNPRGGDTTDATAQRQ